MSEGGSEVVASSVGDEIDLIADLLASIPQMASEEEIMEMIGRVGPAVTEIDPNSNFGDVIVKSFNEVQSFSANHCCDL